MRRNLQFSAAMRKFKLVSWIVAVLCFSKCTDGFKLSQSYSVVEALGNSCPASESCEYRRGDVSEALKGNYICSCDLSCVEYDNCCIDAPAFKFYVPEKKRVTCIEVEDQEGVLMIDSCPKEYNGSEIVRQLCDLIYVGYQSNPLVARPITDFYTGITYKNFYCHACNKNTESLFDRRYFFTYWPLESDCSHSPQTSIDPEKKSEEIPMHKLGVIDLLWPFGDDRHSNVEPHPYFKGCYVVPKVPKVPKYPSGDSVRRCRPNPVSDCPPLWKDENVRSMCKSYTGVRYDHDGRGYRNVHCAICNGADVTQLSCQPPKRTKTFPHLGNSWYAQMKAVKEKMRKCYMEGNDRYCEQKLKKDLEIKNFVQFFERGIKY